MAQRFDDGTVALGTGVTAALTEIQINVGTSQVTADATATLTLPQNLIDSLASDPNQTLLVMYLQAYASDDEEAGESIDTFEVAASTYDSTNHTLTATIPSNAFQRQDDNSYAAVIKVALLSDPWKSTSAVASSELKLAQRAGTSENICLLPQETPITNFANPLNNAQLKIVGPYGEPDHAGKYHGGIDFRASTGTPVYAAQSGYIETISQTSTGAVYMVIRHPDDSATGYLHLARGSLGDGLKTINEITKTDSKGNKYQYYKEETPCPPKYPVTVGHQIALSGTTGTAAPHLHFSYVPHNYRKDVREKGASGKKDASGTLSYGSTINPISFLGQLKARFIGSGGTSATLGNGVAQATVQLSFTDNTTEAEILVRRDKPNTFVSAVAQGDWTPLSNPGSYTKVFSIEWDTPTEPITLKSFDGFFAKHSEGNFNYDSAQAQFGLQSGETGSANNQTINVKLFPFDPTRGQSTSESLTKSLNVAVGLDANLDDFRFEFSDESDGTLVCQRLLGSAGNSPTQQTFFWADFDNCQRYVTPVMRCVGTGCFPNRFFASETRYTNRRDKTVIWTGNYQPPACNSEFEDLIRKNRYSDYSESYVPGAFGWYALSGSYRYVFPETEFNQHLSGFKYTIRRNFSNIDASGLVGIYGTNIPSQCTTTSQQFEVYIRIFDTLRTTYASEVYRVQIPSANDR